MSDESVYNLSVENDEKQTPFLYKGFEYINDSNNGIYSSGQVIMSTESISNNGSWASYREACIKAPLCLVINATKGTTVVDMATIKAEYIAGLKSGYHNLIASVNCEYNNGSLIQQCNFSNVYCSYKLNTSMSQDDLHTIGPSIGIPQLDSCDSWVFRNDNPSACGIGSCNNNNASKNFGGRFGYSNNQGVSGNEGFIARQLCDNLVLDGQNVTADSLGGDMKAGLQQLSNDTRLTTVGANRVITSGTQANGTSATCIYLTATIYLKHLHDFFNKIPLVRGAVLKFTLNFNLPSFQIQKLPSTGATANDRLMSDYMATNLNNAADFFSTRPADKPLLYFDPSTYVAPGSGSSNPVMIASCFTDCGLAESTLTTNYAAGADRNATQLAYAASIYRFNVSLSIGDPQIISIQI